jgi:hypothetical protein
VYLYTQELWALYNSGKLGADVTILDRVPPSPQYETLVGTTKYCLAPYGHGWGWRLSAYMALGCVPVILQVSAPGDMYGVRWSGTG